MKTLKYFFRFLFKWPGSGIRGNWKNAVIKRKFEKFFANQKDLDPEFNDILNEHIWDMIDDEPKKDRL